uniref:OBG-type G domain-containing protein n=1 Tax=Aureoumbra lagunensis TaxID=44058 RepID=A0A7S3JUU1_9STRA
MFRRTFLPCMPTRFLNSKRGECKFSTGSVVLDHGTRFCDRATVKVIAGSGGRGIVAYQDKRGARKGIRRRACGGNGGRGGDIIVVASEAVNSLYNQHGAVVQGENGKNGSSNQRRGANANNTYYYVPPGTIVRVKNVPEALDFEKINALNNEILAEYHLIKHGDQVNVAKGGNGGYGNAGLSRLQNIQAYRKFNETESTSKFYKSPFGHTKRNHGEIRLLELELQSIADIGFVGKPNAGKSSLLAALSAATPKIASYPFTTLRPHIGKCEFKKVDPKTNAIIDFDSIQLADVPGLIEGAAEGRGLGIDFLRHVFRARALVFVVDASNGINSLLHDIYVIHNEIASSQWRGYTDENIIIESDQDDEKVHYGIAGSGRPAILFANKFDLLSQEIRDTILFQLKRIHTDIGFLDVLTGSALTGDGIPQLANRLRRLIRIDLLKYSRNTNTTTVPATADGLHPDDDAKEQENFDLQTYKS